MSKRDDISLLEDINDCIEKILRYAKDLDLSMFLVYEKTQDAIARNFEIISEASARLSEGFKESYPSINWRILKEFRDKLIHVLRNNRLFYCLECHSE